MSRYRWLVLGVMIVTMASSAAPGDVIWPSVGAGAPLVAAPEVGRSGAEEVVPSGLALSPALIEGTWTDLSRRPLLGADRIGGALADLAVRDESAGSLGRPGLPSDPLLGASSERILAERASRGPAPGVDAAPARNIRIPEPASLALVAAGLIGLFARGRLRRNLHTQVEKIPA